MTDRYGASREEVARWLSDRGEPRYRLEQLWDVLYRNARPLGQATTLPRALVDAFGREFPLALHPVTTQRDDADATTKWLLVGADGVQVETVLMETGDRATVCVSTQAGCAMGCTFCATGQAGFDRHLTAGEIVEQVVRAAHAATAGRVSNVVFMGMGEPLANVDATLAALTRLHDDLGISARRLTVSTVGIVPGIRRLAAAPLPVTLAVSLHAPNDALRDTMLPVNRRYPLADLVAAAGDFGRARGRRVTFEYAVIEHVNDLPIHARELAELLRPLGPLGRHVNVIPLNPTRDYEGRAPTALRVRDFAHLLTEHGLTVTIRRNRGTAIDAACGQLRERVRDATADSTRMAP
jgi:23S rRNA (adenine2503-C2)-methyltransferase